MKSFSDYALHIFIGLGFLVFYLDSLTPPGYAEWILYTLLLFIFTRHGNKTSVFIIASLYTILVIAGYFTYHPGKLPLSIPLLNRSLCIISLIIVTIISTAGRGEKKDNSR